MWDNPNVTHTMHTTPTTASVWNSRCCGVASLLFGDNGRLRRRQRARRQQHRCTKWDNRPIEHGTYTHVAHTHAHTHTHRCEHRNGVERTGTTTSNNKQPAEAATPWKRTFCTANSRVSAATPQHSARTCNAQQPGHGDGPGTPTSANRQLRLLRKGDAVSLYPYALSPQTRRCALLGRVSSCACAVVLSQAAPW